MVTNNYHGITAVTGVTCMVLGKITKKLLWPWCNKRHKWLTLGLSMTNHKMTITYFYFQFMLLQENTNGYFCRNLKGPAKSCSWLWVTKVLHCRNMIFFTFLAPVTLTLTWWLSYTNLTSIPWRYTACANMKFLRQGHQKLSSDRQTDTTKIIYQAASQVVNNQVTRVLFI